MCHFSTLSSESQPKGFLLYCKIQDPYKLWCFSTLLWRYLLFHCHCHSKQFLIALRHLAHFIASVFIYSSISLALDSPKDFEFAFNFQYASLLNLRKRLSNRIFSVNVRDVYDLKNETRIKRTAILLKCRLILFFSALYLASYFFLTQNRLNKMSNNINKIQLIWMTKAWCMKTR